jgi:hypothetical protein
MARFKPVSSARREERRKYIKMKGDVIGAKQMGQLSGLHLKYTKNNKKN